MKRFHLFQFDNYYPSGGLSDYQGSYDTVEDAKAAIEAGPSHWDYFEIVTMDDEGNLVVVEDNY